MRLTPPQTPGDLRAQQRAGTRSSRTPDSRPRRRFQAVAQVSVKTLAPADLGLRWEQKPRIWSSSRLVPAGLNGRNKAGSAAPQFPGDGLSPQSCMPCRLSRPAWNCWHGQEDASSQRRRPESCAAPNGSGTSSRRSRNTMRVNPYAIRSPSRNARHTALRAPGGSISTSGCSCRYRSSLRTWSGGPGGTSCTGQYRCPESGPRNRLLKIRPTRRCRYGCPPPTRTCRRPSQTQYHHYMLVGLRLSGCCLRDRPS